MKAIDCFMFNNEVDLVLARMGYLDTIMDHFVIIEADRTHSNKPKTSHFDENKHRFEKFKDKIILKQIQFNELCNSDNSWNRENYQRDYISTVVDEFGDSDIFHISDADEIPDVRTFHSVVQKAKEFGALRLSQEMFYYNLSNRLISFPYWGAAFLSTKERIRSSGGELSNMRLGNNNRKIENCELCGWHLTYFMPPEKIKEKIQSFAHVEFDTDRYTNVNSISSRVQNKIDPYEREDHAFITVNPDEHFPEEFLKHFGAWR